MMSYHVDIAVPETWTFTYLDVMPQKWAKANCPSYITNNAVQRSGTYYYRFFFSQQKDAVAFALKWK